MTMTMEEITTTLTLTEQRNVARASTTEPASIVGQVFNIPAGYRVIEDEVPHSTADRFLVTSVDDEGYSPNTLASIRGAILGVAISDVRAGHIGERWFSPGRNGLPSAYVRGAWVRRGIMEAPSDKDLLVCFADGTVAQWYPNSRTGRRSLELILDSDGSTPAELTGIDFDGQDWVPVEATTPAEEPSVFSVIPAGWKLAPTPVPGREPNPHLRDLYVISTAPAFSDSGAKYAGTIQRGRPNYAGDEWIFEGELGGYFATAALIDPPMEAGEYYWLDKQQRLAKADDALVLWSADNEDRIIPAIDMRPWVKVVRDEVETSLQPETAAGPAVFPYRNERTRESPTLGLAASTNPELDPEPVAGGEYVAWVNWTPGRSSLLLRAAKADDGTLILTRSGSFRCTDQGELIFAGDNEIGPLGLAELRESFHWVKAVLTPAEIPAGEASPSLRSQINVLQERRETYSDALNELAEEHGWCSEYESVVQSMGFPGRTEMAKDYAVTLAVTFSMDDQSPSSRMDRRVETEIFADNVSSLSLTEMTFSGTLEFTMSVYGVKPAHNGSESLDTRITEALSDQITDAAVEGALEALLPGSFSVSEWRIEGYEEEEG